MGGKHECRYHIPSTVYYHQAPYSRFFDNKDILTLYMIYNRFGNLAQRQRNPDVCQIEVMSLLYYKHQTSMKETINLPAHLSLRHHGAWLTCPKCCAVNSYFLGGAGGETTADHPQAPSLIAPIPATTPIRANLHAGLAPPLKPPQNQTWLVISFHHWLSFYMSSLCPKKRLCF